MKQRRTDKEIIPGGVLIAEEVAPERMPEEVRETLQRMDEKRERDLLWSGEKTIKETYSQTSSLFADLADYLRGVLSGLPEGGLNISDKYTELVDSALILSEYYRKKSEGVEVDGRLADRLYSPGWETLRVLADLPEEIKSELLQDLQEKKDSPLYGTASSTLRETAKVIRDYLPTLTPEETETSLFPESPTLEEKEDYIIQRGVSLLRILQITLKLDREIQEVRDQVSPKLKTRCTEYRHTTEIVLDSLSRVITKGYQGAISLEEAKDKYNNTKELDFALSNLLAEKEKYYKILDIDGERRIVEFNSEPKPSSALEEIQKITRDKYSQSGQIRVPKDLWESQIQKKNSGDVLTSLPDGALKKHIQTLQQQGKLLAGTLEGLSGGTSYLKVFTIALAKTLNEQSRYYKTDGDWSGVPKDLISDLVGDQVTIHREPVKIKGEDRQYPYILISYEDMARKTSKTGKHSGGKDAEYVRKFINGHRETITDKKTGRTKEVFIPGIKDKQYIIDLGDNNLGGVPFLVNEMTIYTKDTGKEVGCICKLSPQFSQTIRGYSGLRSDTIQLLGGGKQKDITMDLIDTLIFNRGVHQKGRPEGEFSIRKTQLLDKYRETSNYKGRPGKLETHFREAIQKAINAKLLLPGETKTGGLRGYREEKNSGGETLSVFVYNPDYLKGEEIPQVDEQ